MLLKAEQVERALVFSRTKHGADKIVRMLEAAGIRRRAIHGNKSQAQRERALGLVQLGPDAGAGRDRHRRARDRHPGRLPRHQLRLARSARAICPPHRPHRARRRRGQAIAFCAHEERGLLRDIERLTRQKIDVAPLPAEFRETAEKLRRLKPAPTAGRGAAVPPASRAFKSDRRADGQRREHRNERSEPSLGRGPTRHRPQRTDRPTSRSGIRIVPTAIRRTVPKAVARKRRSTVAGGRPAGQRRAQG